MAKTLSRPSFESPLYAFVRQGSKELGQGLPALPGSIRVVEEPGTLGNPTQQVLTEESGALREKRSIFDRYNSEKFDRSERERGIDR